ncbi:MAG: Uma2 family endonuclease [Chloroflexi bacterium]|nr:Uma2 family endonuclease [Chloroflexota bacterium]
MLYSCYQPAPRGLAMSTEILLEKAPTRETIPAASDFVTLEDYFAIAAEREERIEYIDGEIFFMDGVTFAHGRIQINVIRILLGQLAADEYVIQSSSVSVHIDPSAYLLPDLSVIRGREQPARRGTALVNPALVVEVLSKSTAYRDHGVKLQRYREIPSLEHYLIIEQQRVYVELHSRVDGAWAQRAFSALEETVPLDSLGASLSLAQIYRGIDLAHG